MWMFKSKNNNGPINHVVPTHDVQSCQKEDRVLFAFQKSKISPFANFPFITTQKYWALWISYRSAWIWAFNKLVCHIFVISSASSLDSAFATLTKLMRVRPFLEAFNIDSGSFKAPKLIGG